MGGGDKGKKRKTHKWSYLGHGARRRESQIQPCLPALRRGLKKPGYIYLLSALWFLPFLVALCGTLFDYAECLFFLFFFLKQGGPVTFTLWR